jgi:hypothetical protein
MYKVAEESRRKMRRMRSAKSNGRQGKCRGRVSQERGNRMSGKVG